MKLFSSELGHNYDSYTFGYTNYAGRQQGDALLQIYEEGYLPYSAARGVKDIFYMARSVRVPLARWEATSENRRIEKKFDGMFEKKRIPFADFVRDEAFFTFCLNYFAQKHGAKAMSRERLELILDCRLVSTIIVYYKEGVPVAYVFEVEGENVGHYWFSFYDLSLARQSLGMWLMLDCVRDAKNAGLDYYYLGTVYGEKALYKTNFEPLQWWDGAEWSNDIAHLRERGHTDEKRIIEQMDAWKEDKEFFN